MIAAGELCGGKKRRSERGFGHQARALYIADDDAGPCGVSGRAAGPPAVSRLGGDATACRVAHEFCAGQLTGGDLGHFKRPGQTIAIDRPSPPLFKLAFQLFKLSQFCKIQDVYFSCSKFHQTLDESS
jgi:hypothetical protein